MFNDTPGIAENHLRMFNGLFGEDAWDTFAFVHARSARSAAAVTACKPLQRLRPLAVEVWDPDRGLGPAINFSDYMPCRAPRQCAKKELHLQPTTRRDILSSMSQKYQVLRAHELFSGYAREHGTSQRYGLVVRCRFDAVFDNQYTNREFFADRAPSLDDVMLAVRAGQIVLPAEHRWEGENDRFAIGSPVTMGAYARQYRHLVNPSKCRWGAWQEPLLSCT